MEYNYLNSEGEIDRKKITDTISIVLNSKQIEKLNKILGSPDEIKEKIVADCFYPRHNLLFLDKKNNITTYVLVCFECNQLKSNKKINQNLKNYETFFNELGLKVFYNPMEHHDYFENLKSKKQSR